jgi:hypothetical protein
VRRFVAIFRENSHAVTIPQPHAVPIPRALRERFLATSPWALKCAFHVGV